MIFISITSLVILFCVCIIPEPDNSKGIGVKSENKTKIRGLKKLYGYKEMEK